MIAITVSGSDRLSGFPFGRLVGGGLDGNSSPLLRALILVHSQGMQILWWESDELCNQLTPHAGELASLRERIGRSSRLSSILTFSDAPAGPGRLHECQRDKVLFARPLGVVISCGALAGLMTREQD